MKLQMRIVTILMGLACLLSFNGHAADNIVDIGSNLELFVDRYLIDRLEGTHLELHHPIPAGTAIRFDKPWEGIVSGYVTVILDGDTYRLYYRGRPTISQADGSKEAQEVTCYAESPDGITWTKPNLGIYEIDGTRDNNVILSPDFLPMTHNISPFLDTRPGVPHSERFKAVGGTSQSGLVPFISEDGIHWKKLQDEAIIKEGALDSQNTVFWSSTEECYVCYYRTWTNNVRWISRTTSKDFLHWNKGEDMEFGDAPHEHLYTNQTRPYFRAPHIYIGTAARFIPGRRALTDAQIKEIDLFGPHNYENLNEALSDAVLLSSRGGTHYDRTFLESFIRMGMDLHNWVARSNYPALGIVPSGENEISLYVQRRYGQPSAYLERLTLRTDGFVSVQAPYTGGEMLTEPFRFKGEQLLLNLSTSAVGSTRVEIQDESGKPIPGYTLDDAISITCDEIERVATWKDRPNVNELQGKPIRLRFVMKDADLYSIRFN